MASIHSIPIEVLDLIYRKLDVKDSVRLGRCCKSLYASLIPEIYKSVKDDVRVMLWAAHWGELGTLKKLEGANFEKTWNKELVHDHTGLTNISSHYSQSSEPTVQNSVQQVARVTRPRIFPEKVYAEITCTTLHVAASKGHLEVINFLLDKHIDINALGEDSNWANSQIDIVHSSLLPHNLSEYNKTGKWTPLHFAICNRHLEPAKQLMSQGSSIRVGKRSITSDRRRYPTALHSAAAAGCRLVLSAVVGHFLPEIGDIDLVDDKGYTALIWAFKYRNWDAFEFLLGYGANMARAVDMGTSMIQISCKSLDVDAVLFLLRVGKGEALPIRHITLALHNLIRSFCAVWHPGGGDLIPEREAKVESIIRILLTRGAQIQPPMDPFTSFQLPLVAMARCCRSGIIRILLNHGANINAHQIDGLTALHAACSAIAQEPMSRVLATVKFLLQRGASLQNTSPGPTVFDHLFQALYWCYSNQRDPGGGVAYLLHILLDYGLKRGTVRPSCLDQFLDYFRINRFDCCRILARHGAIVPKPTLEFMIMHAIQDGDAGVLRFVFSLDGADGSLVTDAVMNAVMEQASSWRRNEMIAFLRGIDTRRAR
ncbi:hypothetical protein PFICI_08311 [Pestalotiopsis fici W106-1]|uniref:F-box domain-containing protein n=1 Tax=Pestalotiopsis fici (strain W106-1 / CGMCC3.15140) TaxID=1229662 RepID=W3X5Y3_PESFW|nr:uncharacterized protein PFICI_08311 [Pestalotiopsis fici W106-1]ETS80782.1 hypothetical protein PFICI_08311 [Pestalotiopsis fici W106-1]